MTQFWSGKRVFLTGHTGFKGAWLALWLRDLGAAVTGYALAPHTQPSLHEITGAQGESIIADVRDHATMHRAMTRADPQVVIHMAAQALVKESYRNPIETYASNVMGTGIVLQACRDAKNLQCVLVITSDKVYENHGEGKPFVETDRLGGHDPYSNSKACTELLVSSFRDSFYPDAVRPWQHVLEPLSGYLMLAEKMAARPHGIPQAINFGPEPASFCTVREVVETFSSRFDGKPGWETDHGTHPPEAKALTLSSKLASESLRWHPRLDVQDSLEWSADWYRAHLAGEDMLQFSRSQLRRYQSLRSATA
jgi:CDP-glucose 4,6-dehydratase